MFELFMLYIQQKKIMLYMCTTRVNAPLYKFQLNYSKRKISRNDHKKLVTVCPTVMFWQGMRRWRANYKSLRTI
jgi:hypothetical protein